MKARKTAIFTLHVALSYKSLFVIATNVHKSVGPDRVFHESHIPIQWTTPAG